MCRCGLATAPAAVDGYDTNPRVLGGGDAVFFAARASGPGVQAGFWWWCRMLEYQVSALASSGRVCQCQVTPMMDAVLVNEVGAECGTILL